MKRAYLIDRESLGGGMEYIRRKIAAHAGDECAVFFSCKGECTARNMNRWGAGEIHANHLKALFQLFRNPFVRPRAKVVFTVHGLHLRKYGFLPKTVPNRLKRALRLSLERWLYAKCDRIVALTPTDAADVKRLYGENLPVDIEPNSVDKADFLREEGMPLKYAECEFAYICIARFDFPKGIDVLIEAASLAQDQLRGSSRRILLIGDGPEYGSMKRLAAERGVEDVVEFAGAIPNAGAYMKCAGCVVSPSRWEGMPYLMLEAVAKGCKVIASDCPGNRDVLAGYPDARFFPVEDARALAKLLAEG